MGVSELKEKTVLGGEGGPSLLLFLFTMAKICSLWGGHWSKLCARGQRSHIPRNMQIEQPSKWYDRAFFCGFSIYLYRNL